MNYEEAKENIVYRRFTSETIEKIYEALEKQIPKKVLPDTEYLEGICPCCGVHFLDRSTKFCGNCGQALDWGKNNE